ncbi:MAG: UDP-glucose 4-epimerase GalE, partial [Stellaceae bacterium]
RKVPWGEAGRRPGDPPELVADPALARSLLGWQSRQSDLDTIIGTALAWETRPRGPAATTRK